MVVLMIYFTPGLQPLRCRRPSPGEPGGLVAPGAQGFLERDSVRDGRLRERRADRRRGSCASIPRPRGLTPSFSERDVAAGLAESGRFWRPVRDGAGVRTPHHAARRLERARAHRRTGVGRVRLGCRVPLPTDGRERAPPSASTERRVRRGRHRRGRHATGPHLHRSFLDLPWTSHRSQYRHGTQVVSVPWHQVGPLSATGRLTIRYALPGCGRPFGIEAVGDRTSTTLSVDAIAPDEALPCPAPMSKTETVDLSPPGSTLSPGPLILHHGALGLVRQIQSI